MDHSTAQGGTESVASEEKVVLAAVEWLRSELRDPEIAESENFLDVGGHSLTFSKLNVFLAESFGVGLDQRITYERSLGEAVAAMRPAELCD